MTRHLKSIRQKLKNLRGRAGTPESTTESYPSHPVSVTEADPLPPTENDTEVDTSPLPDGNSGTKDAAVTLVFPSRDRQDLWREAFLKLDDAEQALLGFAPTSAGDDADEIDNGEQEKKQRDMALAIQEILGTADALKKQDEAKQYTTRLNKVIDGTTKVKSLIDAGLAFDPTKYGALGWAVVSFGLQMTINAKEIREFTLDSCDYIVNIIARYSIYELQYSGTAHPSSTTDSLKGFEEGVTAVYTSILQFLGNMKGYLGQSWLEHGAASILPKAERTLSKTKENIIAQDLEVQSWLPILEHESVRSQFQTVLKKLNDFLDDQSQAAVLSWLPNGNMDRIHAQIRSRAEVDFSQNYQPGAWLLKDINLQLWSDAQCSCGLWLYGDMGTGKTVLTSTVIEQLERQYNGSSGGALAYFYCSASESTRTDPLDILLEILRQMTATKSGLNIFREWQQNKKPAALTRDAVLRLILQMINLNAHRQTTIVIDALDEIDRDGTGLSSITDALHYLLEEAGGLVKVFVSSRSESRIRDQLRAWAKIPVHPGSTRSDIETFIELEVNRLLRYKTRVADLKPKIKETLKERAGGMFRYVQMSTEWICRGESPLEINQAIAELPSELSGIYRNLFERMEKRRKLHQDYARLAISWILGMRLVLRAGDLLQAIIAGMDDVNDVGILETSIDDVLTACEGIVTYNKARDVLEFGHVSVLEFIQQNKQDMYNRSQVHLRIGSTCVKVLEGMHQIYHTPEPESHNKVDYEECHRQLLRKRMELIGHWACPSCLTIEKLPLESHGAKTFIQYANMMWALHCASSGAVFRVGSPFDSFTTTLRGRDLIDPFGDLALYLLRKRLFYQGRNALQHLMRRWIEQFADPIAYYVGPRVRLLVVTDTRPGSDPNEKPIEFSPFAVLIEMVDKLMRSARNPIRP